MGIEIFRDAGPVGKAMLAQFPKSKYRTDPDPEPLFHVELSVCTGSLTGPEERATSIERKRKSVGALGPPPPVAPTIDADNKDEMPAPRLDVVKSLASIVWLITSYPDYFKNPDAALRTWKAWAGAYMWLIRHHSNVHVPAFVTSLTHATLH